MSDPLSDAVRPYGGAGMLAERSSAPPPDDSRARARSESVGEAIPRPRVVIDPERARVELLLRALRPATSNPLVPPPPRATELDVPHARSSRPPWDHDGPRGFDRVSFEPEAPDAHVLARLSCMSANDRTVLEWLRDHANLQQTEKPENALRALYYDVGVRFASPDMAARWVDLTVRRCGAPDHGRRLVLLACRAWGV